jgi:hypothetical protein
MKVVDNFLTPAYQDAVEDLLLSPMFPWYLNQSSVQTTSDAPYMSAYGVENTIEAPQFTNTLIWQGSPQSEHVQFISLITNMLMLTQNIRTDNLHRVKANLGLQVPNSFGKHFTKHVDIYKDDDLKEIGEGYITCIYYVNDCDGDTIFFSKDGKEEIGRVSPKKGRIVYFPVNTPHAGQPPMVSDRRCVINFNLLQKDI